MSAHPHAALMSEFAKDAAETDKPSDRWEYSHDDGESWDSFCGDMPLWDIDTKYRRKPKPLECWANVWNNGIGYHETEEQARDYAGCEGPTAKVLRTAVRMREVTE